jgi:hypothetical protein
MSDKLDVFLAAFREGAEVPVDRDALEIALARNGLSGDSTEARTLDGGRAQLLVDDDGASFLVQALTPELSTLVFDVARDARLVVLPADGTPTAFLVDGTQAGDLPHDLVPKIARTSAALYELLRESAEVRGAQTA